MSISRAPGRVPEWSLGNRLYKAREDLGMDRGSFAELIGVDRNAITRYESDRVLPRPIVINAWALATGVDVGWLRTGVPSVPTPTPGGGDAFVAWERRREGLMPETRWFQTGLPLIPGVAAA